MEELESLLVSVKAWASKILEALGLCRKDCDALKVENEALKIENTHLMELAKVPVIEPEEKPFDLGPILVLVGEFKQAIETVNSKLDALSAKVDGLAKLAPIEFDARLAAIETVNEELRDKLHALFNKPALDLSGFINKVTVDLDYFRQKLNRLPF